MFINLTVIRYKLINILKTVHLYFFKEIMKAYNIVQYCLGFFRGLGE